MTKLKTQDNVKNWSISSFLKYKQYISFFNKHLDNRPITLTNIQPNLSVKEEDVESKFNKKIDNFYIF